MVFRHDGTLKMLLTVKLTNGKHSLALAERTGAGWEVVDVLETIQGEIIESPFLYEQEGLLHLFLNNWRDGGQAAWTSASLLGVWSRQVNELRGFAFELLELDSGYLMASRVWGSSILFTQFSLQDYESTNMVFPECYTGANALLSFGDNIVDVGVPLN
jgi:hypothetical protein